jgi:hypothetical protein
MFAFIIHKKGKQRVRAEEDITMRQEGPEDRLKTFPVKFIILFYVCINYECESGEGGQGQGRHSDNALDVYHPHTFMSKHVLSVVDGEEANNGGFALKGSQCLRSTKNFSLNIVRRERL